MKLFSIYVLYKPPGTNGEQSNGSQARILKSACDLTSFGFFQRGSVEEFMKFTSKVITERSSPSTRSSVKEQEYFAHVYLRDDNLAGVLISDQEYPKRVAHSLLTKVLDEFSKTVPRNQWDQIQDNGADYKDLPGLLTKYQDPKEADALMKLQMDLDETKIVLHQTIESVLQRGETLDKLVSQSEDLSYGTRTLYQKTKDNNACCTYL